MKDGRSAFWSRWYSAAALAAVAACLLLVFTVAPIRLWAEQLLSIFRVQHIAVLDLDMSSFVQDPNAPQFNERMGKALSDQITVLQKPTQPRTVADQEAASRATGFPVRLLDEQSPAKLEMESGAAVSMKLNRERLQSILDEAGRGNIQIPSSVDGATIAVRIPASVMAEYGDCRYESQRSMHAAVCFHLLQVPSPVVSAPAQIDPAQIAETALEIAGVKPEIAQEYMRTIDWGSTLVLPLPSGFASKKQVLINGNEGLLLRRDHAGMKDDFILVWLDNGIVYSLAGEGDDDLALKLANNLH